MCSKVRAALDSKACCKAFGLAQVSCSCSVPTKCLEGGVSCCVVHAPMPAAYPFVMGRMILPLALSVLSACVEMRRALEVGSLDVDKRGCPCSVGFAAVLCCCAHSVAPAWAGT